MRYGEMRQRYPVIDEAFAQVSRDIHSGRTAVEALNQVRPWVKRHILQPDCSAVLVKLERFATVIEQNRRETCV